MKTGATLGAYSLFDLYQWSVVASAGDLAIIPAGDVLATSTGDRIKTSQGTLIAIVPDVYSTDFSKSFNSQYL